ncbi:hypothetical protein F5B20DRAFT_580093 [Whalleya microplaca]|nr:hypothetical protein F5B20DRAFT_580093 [Whalleya microplaca]
MRSISLVTPIVAFASAAYAGAIPRADPYVGDFRTFSEAGCKTINQGVGTVTHSMTNVCIAYPETFNSMYLHLTDGWKFVAHTDNNCRDNGTAIISVPFGATNTVCSDNRTHNPWMAFKVWPVVK